MANFLGERWLKEYIPTLKQQGEWRRVLLNIKPGTLVLLVDDITPKGHWNLATVLETYLGLAYKNGRYEVSLPWKDEQVVLKDNYKQARSRLYNLEKNLLQDSSKAKSYQEAINKYVEDGVAEEVPYEQYVLCFTFHIMPLSEKISKQLRRGLYLMHPREM